MITKSKKPTRIIVSLPYEDHEALEVLNLCLIFPLK